MTPQRSRGFARDPSWFSVAGFPGLAAVATCADLLLGHSRPEDLSQCEAAERLYGNLSQADAFVGLLLEPHTGRWGGHVHKDCTQAAGAHTHAHT